MRAGHEYEEPLLTSPVTEAPPLDREVQLLVDCNMISKLNSNAVFDRFLLFCPEDRRTDLDYLMAEFRSIMSKTKEKAIEIDRFELFNDAFETIDRKLNKEFELKLAETQLQYTNGEELLSDDAARLLDNISSITEEFSPEKAFEYFSNLFPVETRTDLDALKKGSQSIIDKAKTIAEETERYDTHTQLILMEKNLNEEFYLRNAAFQILNNHTIFDEDTSCDDVFYYIDSLTPEDRSEDLSDVREEIEKILDKAQKINNERIAAFDRDPGVVVRDPALFKIVIGKLDVKFQQIIGAAWEGQLGVVSSVALPDGEPSPSPAAVGTPTELAPSMDLADNYRGK